MYLNYLIEKILKEEIQERKRIPPPPPTAELVEPVAASFDDIPDSLTAITSQTSIESAKNVHYQYSARGRNSVEASIDNSPSRSTIYGSQYSGTPLAHKENLSDYYSVETKKTRQNVTGSPKNTTTQSNNGKTTNIALQPFKEFSVKIENTDRNEANCKLDRVKVTDDKVGKINNKTELGYDNQRVSTISSKSEVMEKSLHFNHGLKSPMQPSGIFYIYGTYIKFKVNRGYFRFFCPWNEKSIKLIP